MRIGNRVFDKGTHIMGILNVTPDSFSDGGMWNDPEAALLRAERMICDGAEIIDVGGESTRPGYEPVSEQEEIERVVPVIERIKREFNIPVSIDTQKSTVARAALGAGADMINDIWGFKGDTNMAAVCKEFDASCCLMHNRIDARYRDFARDVISDLKESIEIARAAGIEDDRICVDPGVGFAKTLDENLFITQNADLLHELGYPILLGTSRKSMIGLSLGLDKDKRLEGTLVTTVLAVQTGCRFVRVHDIKENFRAIKMAQALFEKARK